MQVLINDESVDELLELINDTESFGTAQLIDVENVDLGAGTVLMTVMYRVPKDKLAAWCEQYRSDSQDEESSDE